MKLLIFLCFFLISPFSLADNPLFKDEILTISNVDSPEQTGVYQNVSFKQTREGVWELLDFHIGRPLDLPSATIEIIVTDSFPVQVFLKVIQGFGASCLIDKGHVNYRLVNKSFEVVLYYEEPNLLDPIACDQAVFTLEKIIPLPVYGLNAGNYTYNINDIYTGSFNLKIDNKF